MKTLNVYGDNRFENYTKIREACRGIVINDNKILLSYETNTDIYNIPYKNGIRIIDEEHHIPLEKFR